MAPAQAGPALRHALKLMVLSPEFHATNIAAAAELKERPPPEPQASQNRPYGHIHLAILCSCQSFLSFLSFS